MAKITLEREAVSVMLTPIRRASEMLRDMSKWNYLSIYSLRGLARSALENIQFTKAALEQIAIRAIDEEPEKTSNALSQEVSFVLEHRFIDMVRTEREGKTVWDGIKQPYSSIDQAQARMTQDFIKYFNDNKDSMISAVFEPMTARMKYADGCVEVWTITTEPKEETTTEGK